jgi:hypothetical protein
VPFDPQRIGRQHRVEQGDAVCGAALVEERGGLAEQNRAVLRGERGGAGEEVGRGQSGFESGAGARMGDQGVAGDARDGGAEGVVGDEAFAAGPRGQAEQLVGLRAVGVARSQRSCGRQQRRDLGRETARCGRGLRRGSRGVGLPQRKMADLSARHFLSSCHADQKSIVMPAKR